MSGDTVWKQLRQDHGEFLISTLEPSELSYAFLRAGLISWTVNEELLNEYIPRYRRNHKLLLALESNSVSKFSLFLDLLYDRRHRGVVERIAPNYQPPTGYRQPQPNGDQGESEPGNSVLHALLSDGVNMVRLKTIFKAFPLGDHLISQHMLTTQEYNELWQRETKSFSPGDTFMWLLNVIEAKPDDQKAVFISKLKGLFAGAFCTRKSVIASHSGGTISPRRETGPQVSVTATEESDGRVLSLVQPIVEEETSPPSRQRPHTQPGEYSRTAMLRESQNDGQRNFQAGQSVLMQSAVQRSARADLPPLLTSGSIDIRVSETTEVTSAAKQPPAEQQPAAPVEVEVCQGLASPNAAKKEGEPMGCANSDLSSRRNEECAVDNRMTELAEGRSQEAVKASCGQNTSDGSVGGRGGMHVEGNSSSAGGVSLLELPDTGVLTLVQEMSARVYDHSTCDRLHAVLLGDASAAKFDEASEPAHHAEAIINVWIKSMNAASRVPKGKDLYDAFVKAGRATISEEFAKCLLGEP